MIETHFGVVTSVDDPDMRGRIKVEAPTLIGKNKELPDWVEPSLVFMGSGKGFFAVPDIESVVELLVTTKTPSDESFQQSSLDAPMVRYKPSGVSSIDKLPDVFSTNYPKRSGLSTGAGHFFLDDTKGSEVIHIEHKSGAKIDADGNVFVTPAASKKIHLDDESKSAQSMSRVGDKTAAHTHVISFALVAPLGGGTVTGTITTSSEEPTIAEGSTSIKGGG